MSYTKREILEVIKMTETEHFDVRTVTIGISLLDCAAEDPKICADKIYRKITKYASSLPKAVDEVAEDLGIRVANKRIALTPLSLVATKPEPESYLEIAKEIDRCAGDMGFDYVGGFSALVEAGFTAQENALIESIPTVLSKTARVCSSVNAGTTRMGLNFDAILRIASIIKQTAYLTRENGSIGCAKFVVFANAVENNPFIAGAFHGVGNPEVVINVGLSGPGVVLDAIKRAGNCSIRELSEVIKKASYKVTRVGEIVGREVGKKINVPFGIVDISLAPTPELGDSVGEVLMAMGIETPGGAGTTAALALLTDAVKKGGAMATSAVGGLSGAFIPVSEDSAMIKAASEGHLSLEKLEAMTSVCSVGLDMVAIPGDTSEEVIAGFIADELSIGIINNKTTAVR
ncbi:MAG: PFL family protein, partial [Acidobacteria bacterium]|nr:PFL family protein [Acidobacteriota bacterium]